MKNSPTAALPILTTGWIGQLINMVDNPWAKGSPGAPKGANSNSSPKFSNENGQSDQQLREENAAPKHGKKNSPYGYVKLAVLAIISSWLSTGFYVIEPDQQGVVLRLGSYSRSSFPGLNWKFPDPIETVEKVSVTRINKEFIGVNQGASQNSWNQEEARTDDSNSIPVESQMLTGDENIIDMHFYVQWRIKSAKDYLFNVRDDYGDNTLRASAESAMREVLGVTKLYDALSEKRQKVEKDAAKILQSILDKYQSGIEVSSLGILYSYVPPEVKDAYRDIQSAKADKERFINQALSYRNAIIPQAKGQAQAKLEQSMSYKAARIDDALGAAQRFKSMYDQYKKAPAVIRTKLYFEAMEESYGHVSKMVTSGGTGVVPVVALPGTGGGGTATAAALTKKLREIGTKASEDAVTNSDGTGAGVGKSENEVNKK